MRVSRDAIDEGIRARGTVPADEIVAAIVRGAAQHENLLAFDEVADAPPARQFGNGSFGRTARHSDTASVWSRPHGRAYEVTSDGSAYPSICDMIERDGDPCMLFIERMSGVALADAGEVFDADLCDSPRWRERSNSPAAEFCVQGRRDGCIQREATACGVNAHDRPYPIEVARPRPPRQAQLVESVRRSGRSLETIHLECVDPRLRARAMDQHLHADRKRCGALHHEFARAGWHMISDHRDCVFQQFSSATFDFNQRPPRTAGSDEDRAIAA